VSAVAPLRPASSQDDLARLAAARRASGALPHTPSRDDVVTALNAITYDVLACARGRHGSVYVAIHVVSDGTVTSVTITAGELDGAPVAGTAEGECIAAVVRTARFPPFEREDFTINYPFRL
jgi:hypothetical protein